MASKTYKAIFLPKELHAKIKTSASKKGQSIIQYIASLLSPTKK